MINDVTKGFLLSLRHTCQMSHAKYCLLNAHAELRHYDVIMTSVVIHIQISTWGWCTTTWAPPNRISFDIAIQITMKNRDSQLVKLVLLLDS